MDHTWLKGQPTVQEEPGAADTVVEPALAAVLSARFTLPNELRVA